MGNKFRKGKENYEDDYSQYELLGKGAFATVFRAVKNSNGTEFAVKRIEKHNVGRKELENVMEEVDIMNKIDHPNCVLLHDVFNSGAELILVMDLCRGGHLLDRLKTVTVYTEQLASTVIRQLAEALAFMHAQGITHRDLKPENILFESPVSEDCREFRIKVTDFGLAKYTEPGKRMKEACGTPNYVAPEVILRKPYDNSVDMWSVGVLMYVLLSGYPPFWGSTMQKLLKRICDAKVSFTPEPFQHVSQEAKDVIEKLIAKEPGDRLSADQLLNDCWIKDVNNVSCGHLPAAQFRIGNIQRKKKFVRGVHSIILANALYEVAKGRKIARFVGGLTILVDRQDAEENDRRQKKTIVVRKRTRVLKRYDRVRVGRFSMASNITDTDTEDDNATSRKSNGMSGFPSMVNASKKMARRI